MQELDFQSLSLKDMDCYSNNNDDDKDMNCHNNDSSGGDDKDMCSSFGELCVSNEYIDYTDYNKFVQQDYEFILLYPQLDELYIKCNNYINADKNFYIFILMYIKEKIRRQLFSVNDAHFMKNNNCKQLLRFMHIDINDYTIVNINTHKLEIQDFVYKYPPNGLYKYSNILEFDSIGIITPDILTCMIVLGLYLDSTSSTLLWHLCYNISVLTDYNKIIEMCVNDAIRILVHDYNKFIQ